MDRRRWRARAGARGISAGARAGVRRLWAVAVLAVIGLGLLATPGAPLRRPRRTARRRGAATSRSRCCASREAARPRRPRWRVRTPRCGPLRPTSPGAASRLGRTARLPRRRWGHDRSPDLRVEAGSRRPGRGRVPRCRRGRWAGHRADDGGGRPERQAHTTGIRSGPPRAAARARPAQAGLPELHDLLPFRVLRIGCLEVQPHRQPAGEVRLHGRGVRGAHPRL